MAGEATTNENEEKVIWAENISFLAKERGIKLMDLAEKAGVAVSFFSRARKGDSRADANVLSSMAEMLGVSLDTLMRCDLTEMTENERLVMNFIDKAIIDTNAKKISWVRDTKEIMQDIGEDGEPLYPINSYFDEEDGERHLVYLSLFANDKQTVTPLRQNYHAELSDLVSLYIVSVGVTERKDDEHPGYFQGLELYLVELGDASPICCSYNDTNMQILRRLHELYEVASTSSDHICLSDGTISTMKKYLANNMDKLPF